MPRPIIIMGGADATEDYRYYLENGCCDFVILGEGERIFKELCRALAEDLDYSQISGLAFLMHDEVVCNPVTEYIDDLDQLPLPAYHLLNLQEYSEANLGPSRSFRTPFAYVVTSRGCPFNCIFCSIHSLWGKKYRVRSAKNVVDEIELLVKKHDVHEIFFEDDNLTLNRKRALEICDEIQKRGLDITWSCPSGIAAYALTEDLIIAMKKSGCYKIYISVESGDQDVLSNVIDKPLKLTQVDNVIRWCRKHGVFVEGGFVLGLPGETKQTMKQTVDYALSRRFDAAHFFIAQPYPGTRLRELVESKGYLKEISLSSLKHNQNAVIETEEFDLEFVNELKVQAYRSTNIKYRIENLNFFIFFARLFALRNRRDVTCFKYYFFVRHGFTRQRLFSPGGAGEYFGILLSNTTLYIKSTCGTLLPVGREKNEKI